MSVFRWRSSASLALLLAAGLPLAACNTSTTPGFPTPDFQASLGGGFALRTGELALVVGDGRFLYLSIQSLGADSRCPPESTCEEPGHLVLNLELETAEAQGSIGIQVPPSGRGVATFHGFEIRILEVQPPGREARILPIDYILLMSVSQR